MLDAINSLKFIGDRPIQRTRICGRRWHDIELNTRTNEVRLRLQYGPRSSIGDQGLDPDHIIIFAKELINGLNKKLPCHQNDIAIYHLMEAIKALEERRIDRIKRNVEGTENG